MKKEFYDLPKVKASFGLHHLDRPPLGDMAGVMSMLAGSYSDICGVSAGTVRRFGHYCGVFAAAGLHAELAIPTALVLSAGHIVTEKDLSLRGRALWPDGWNRLHGENDLAHDELKELDRYNRNLDNLLQNFPEGYLYLHPVKLSGWTTQTR